MILIDDFLVGHTDRYTNTSELELGTLTLTSGRLRIRDPFDPHPRPTDDCLMLIPAGTYRVWVTLASLPAIHDTTLTEIREAYLSIELANRTPTRLTYADSLVAPPKPSYGALTGTDSGTIAVFDDTLNTSINRDHLTTALDTTTPLPFNYANIPADNNHNIVVSHSGYGDGAFPILLTSDTDGPLAIHIDFGVLNTGEDDE
ncbi:hypothetical protein BVC93_12525 [Mycobacterium sp. MS1601]|uniref:DUF4241 domain-containing protein n=1 Tax=Mycobacterium sp. MS1601 TaxID=1936029 RepID=UPI0009791F5D|nr:DUF4241 domain-containing protein [Mycobacterium sp. MS1601]AQA03113.1 hypothetical protein BVC93_12525 [Mycobacterium sp. MS1601]